MDSQIRGSQTAQVLAAFGEVKWSSRAQARASCPRCGGSKSVQLTLVDSGRVLGFCHVCKRKLSQLVPKLFESWRVSEGYPPDRCGHSRVVLIRRDGREFLTRKACGSRMRDPDGCGQVYEERWADAIRTAFPEGAVLFAVPDGASDRVRIGLGRGGGKRWVAIPQEAGMRAYLADAAAPNVGEVTSISGAAVAATALRLLRAKPTDERRRVAHSQSVQPWLRRRRVASARVIGFGDPSVDLEVLAEVVGVKTDSWGRLEVGWGSRRVRTLEAVRSRRPRHPIDALSRRARSVPLGAFLGRAAGTGLNQFQGRDGPVPAAL